MGRPRKIKADAPLPEKAKRAKAKTQDPVEVVAMASSDAAGDKPAVELDATVLDLDSVVDAPDPELPEPEEKSGAETVVVESVVELPTAESAPVQADTAMAYRLSNLSPTRLTLCGLEVEAGSSIVVDCRTSNRVEKLTKTVSQLNELSKRNGHGQRLSFEKV